MSMIYAFYNPLAGNGSCKTDVHFLDLLYDEPIVYCDLTKSETYERHLFSVRPEDLLILCGGDGTLHRFLNLLPPETIPCDILCFPLGAHNEFASAAGHPFGSAPFSLRQHLSRLPHLKINGKTLRFLGSVRWTGHIGVAATLTVDGVCHRFRKLRELTIRALPKNRDLSVSVGVRACRIIPWRKRVSLSGREISISFSKAVAPCIDGDLFSPAAQMTAAI